MHDLKTLDSRRHRRDVSGHSQVPNIETIDGILYLNPGRAGSERLPWHSKLPTSFVSFPLILPTALLSATGRSSKRLLQLPKGPSRA